MAFATDALFEKNRVSLGVTMCEHWVVWTLRCGGVTVWGNRGVGESRHGSVAAWGSCGMRELRSGGVRVRW